LANIYIHMKKNELTHIIKEIVAEEIRRELPNAIAEVFQNFLGQKSVVNERVSPPAPKPDPEDEEISLRSSLKEMFAGTRVMTPPQATAGPKNFTKNPVLNEILNQTRPFSPQERTGMGGGMAALMAANQTGMSVPMGTPMAMPSMAPVSQAQLLNDSHIPLSDLPQNVSVMDVAQHAPPVVAQALTRNYSQMMKLIDKKKGKA
jgi:hypothetical protein